MKIAAARRLAQILVLMLALLWAPRVASASQGSCIMPTTGTVSGLTLVNDINICHQAILSVYSGASAPAGPTTGMLWYNTSIGYVQQYDGAAWNNLWFVDTTNHLTTMPIGGGAIPVLTAASTTDLGSVPQAVKAVNGGGTINSFGSSATVGTIHVILFGNSTTLTQNPTTMRLPGGATIVAQGNSMALAVYYGSGQWQVIDYIPSTIPIKASPTISDYVLILDAASSNTKSRALMSAILALVSPGVSSIAGNTGAFLLGTGLSNSGNTINNTGFVTGASQAQQEVGTAATVAVTPSVQQYHPSAAKAFGSFNSSGALIVAYNAAVSSHPSSGLYTVIFTPTPFSSASLFSCVATAVGNNTVYFGTKTAGSIVVNTVQLGSTPIGADVAFDIVCFGDQ